MNVCKDLLNCRDAFLGYSIDIKRGRFICVDGECNHKGTLCCFSCLSRPCGSPSFDKKLITRKNRDILKKAVMLNKLKGGEE